MAESLGGLQRAAHVDTNVAAMDFQAEAMAFDARQAAGPRIGSLHPRARLGLGRMQLRVGYVHAQPWAYHDATGLRGFDVRAMREAARLMGCDLVFLPCAHIDLPALLEAGRIDVAVGGLIVGSCMPGIGFVPVQLARSDDLDERRTRTCYRNLWWYRKDRRVLGMRLKLALVARRVLLSLGLRIVP